MLIEFLLETRRRSTLARLCELELWSRQALASPPDLHLLPGMRHPLICYHYEKWSWSLSGLQQHRHHLAQKHFVTPHPADL